ncbi:hypothetical protein N9R79_07330, partial [Vibrio sp.]|nr:hypothetical protein [Vibrio sp.]
HGNDDGEHRNDGGEHGSDGRVVKMIGMRRHDNRLKYNGCNEHNQVKADSPNIKHRTNPLDQTKTVYN